MKRYVQYIQKEAVFVDIVIRFENLVNSLYLLMGVWKGR